MGDLAHHWELQPRALKSYLDAHIDAAGISDDRKEPLFRNAILKTGKLGKERILCRAVLYMAHRRGLDAGIGTKICCPTFSATEITDYLTNGAERFTAVENYFKQCCRFRGQLSQTARGLAFVQLYAIHEYTVVTAVEDAAAVAAHAHPYVSLRP